MQLRGRDVEQWMSHRRLPEDLRRYRRCSHSFQNHNIHIFKKLCLWLIQFIAC